jgi:hypothetical protein
MENQTVRHAIADFTKDREVGFKKSKDMVKENDMWFRKCRIQHANILPEWMESLEGNKYGISLYISTNILDWDKFPKLPPDFRGIYDVDTVQEWKWQWKELMDSAKKYVIGKNIVFDIDADGEETLMEAFYKADIICEVLAEKNLKPRMVFSGGKGFHIWLTEEDTVSLTDYHISEVDDYPADTLRQLSNIHRDWVKAVSQEALGSQLPYLDESPNFRQGIIRCPYSIHHKSGQVVWPLDEKELNILRKYSMEDSLTVNDIAKLIHEWEIPNESPLVDSDKPTWIHPEAEVFERGLPEWVPPRGNVVSR